MNNRTMCILAFSLGAAVGAIASWGLLKNKYERIAQEEIDSVKEVFSCRYATPAEDNIGETAGAASEDACKKEADEYSDLVDSLEYRNYSEISRKIPAMNTASSRKEHVIGPYIITDEEFGELDDYDTDSLTYYADGVLADDTDNVVEDVEDTVGHESLTHFETGDDALHLVDSVYVRNDEKKYDYEILLDFRRYADVIAAKTEE